MIQRERGMRERAREKREIQRERGETRDTERERKSQRKTSDTEGGGGESER